MALHFEVIRNRAWLRLLWVRRLTTKGKVLTALPGGVVNTVHRPCRFHHVPGVSRGEHVPSEVCLAEHSCNPRAQAAEAGGRWRTEPEARLAWAP